MLVIPSQGVFDTYRPATTFLAQQRLVSGFIVVQSANAAMLQLYTQPTDTGYNPQPLPEFRIPGQSTFNLTQGNLPLAGVAIRNAVAGLSATVNGVLFGESEPQVTIV